MKILLIIGGIFMAVVFLGFLLGRNGGELRLKHEVTVATPKGEEIFFSVVSLNGLQGYNFGPTTGWSNISGRVTGDAVRIPHGDKDFYFVLAEPGFTAGTTQFDLVKKHFGVPNTSKDRSGIGMWKRLARSDDAVDLPAGHFPPLAVMPRDGWLDEARFINLQDAENLGLRVVRYRLQMTRGPVGSKVPVEVRYRQTDDRKVRIEVPAARYLSVKNDEA